MPISEVAHTQSAYRGALSAFAERHGIVEADTGAVSAFHAVRNMPYYSGSDRTPLTALKEGRGACTAKHLILRDLLRTLEFDAEVELVAGDFAASVPEVSTMPDDLKAAVKAGGVRDIHCWVRLRDGDENWLLDATWPDDLAMHGFPVNSTWRGGQDTRPAIEHGVIKESAEDVLARKQQLLAELTEEETRTRKAFLSRLSAWLESLPRLNEGDGR